MERNEIRTEIFSYLKTEYPKAQPNPQISYIFEYLEKKHDEDFCKQYEEVILDLIQEMINNSIIRPFTRSNGFSLFKLTAYGRECIETENLLLYDPDEYIKELKKQIPKIDEITIRYMKESITTYHKDCLLSSTITLGTASENCMLLLIEAFAKAISDPEKREKFHKKIDGLFINAKYKKFREQFNSIEKFLPAALQEGIDPQIDNIFNFIRINRNEAGHPTGTSLSKKEILAFHQIFADYAKKIYSLIDYFSNNPVIL